MKKRVLTILGVSMLVSLTAVSCTLDTSRDEGGVVINNPTNNTPVLSGTVINGTFTSDILIKKGNYTLEGIAKVNPGVTVTFEPGTTITANSNVVSAFIVLKGGKVKMEGTASEPIVWTSDNKKPGDWGGITLYGDAPIKANGGGTTATSEDGLSQIYGGNNPTDNSGSLKFVRVEYAGRKIGEGSSEYNSFTMYSVGSGTVLENLVAYKGTDDGIEFFGGTVSASNIIIYGNTDDSFDWQDGWSGQANYNWYAYQTGVANFGMEIEASNNAETTPPKVNGITLIRAAGTVPEKAGSNEISAIQFKKHGNGIFNNVYAEGYKNTGNQQAYGILIQDSVTESEQLAKGKIKVTPINYLNSDNLGKYGYAVASPNPLTFTSDAKVGKLSFTSGAWATVDGIDLLAPLK
ncbi:MAG: hypothetical protein KBA33_05160 [Cloacibacterium sp.]|jgi:hypothetical protein|nr:hypothetical protein [Cloacibacterium sp.]